MLTASFRVLAADLITTRTDYLVLNIYDVFLGTITPSNLDYLRDNVNISIEPIKFDRIDSGSVNGFYGVGHYFAQIGSISVVLSSAHPQETLRVDEYGHNETSGSIFSVGGFLFISEPNSAGIRRVIYRGNLVSSIIGTPNVVSMWLLAANATDKAVCEVALEAFGNPFDDIDQFTLKFPNMPGTHTANLMYGDEFLPPCPPDDVP